MSDPSLPIIIQGGMGVGVSGWRLARAVSRAGHLGVVSGTSVDTLLVRRLEDGDPGGDLRRALHAFPIPGIAEPVLRRYYRASGRDAGIPYTMLPMFRAGASAARDHVTMLGAFAEVWLAREGHDGAVGMNLLTKIQYPTLPALYGAMLAGVAYVLMGAGIPRDIPGVLDTLASHAPAAIRLEVEGDEPGTAPWLRFDPAAHWGTTPPVAIERPRFLAIVASNSLATMLARKASGQVDGFVVEGPTAGGHNAPPRGPLQLSEQGEPVYGARDVVDLTQLQTLGLPFWLAGGTGSPAALRAARNAGAAGIQVGTLFAFCDESGLDPAHRASVLRAARDGTVGVHTDPRASPTGYPFKVVQWPDAPEAAHAERERVCDLGYLRNAYRRPDGRLGYRCPAEPVETYVAKGGRREDTVGRRCLCNALLADIGLPQQRSQGPEPILLTSGDDLMTIGGFLAGRDRYSAMDVLRYLLDG